MKTDRKNKTDKTDKSVNKENVSKFTARLIASGQYGDIKEIVNFLAEFTAVDYKKIYVDKQSTVVRKKVKKFKHNPKLSWEQNYQNLEKHHVEETAILVERIETLRSDNRYLKDDNKRLKKKVPKESCHDQYHGYSSSSNPIQTGPNSYSCNHCGQPMYYDGRCGDGPVCTNNGCYSKVIAAAYWNDSR